MNEMARGRSGKNRHEITEALAARIVQHIMAERLPSGTHLTAQNLADRFSVSRSPVNQALRLLLAKGAVAHELRRGYFVADMANATPAELGLDEQDELTRNYFRLAEDRLDGLIPDQVSGTFLQQRYGLTRNQLATLLTRVCREGWAEPRPGYGWAFSEMLTTPEALLQTYRLRLALEPTALLEPGYRLDRGAITRLREAETRLLDGAVDTDTADALHDRGVRFHETIIGASGNPFFLDALQRINRVRRLLSYRSMIERRRYIEQCREHLGVLDLLEQGRNLEAAEALRAHLATTIRNLDRIRPLLEH